GFRVSGILLPGEPTRNIDHLGSHLHCVETDLQDADGCRKAVRAIKPDYVCHLAAMASVGRSYDLETLTLRVNVEGTLNVLQAASECKPLKALLFVSSADAYGTFTPKTKTLDEHQPFNPISPYGISKAASEHLALYFHRTRGLKVVVARSFNHSGPRQNNDYVIPAFARQIAAIEAGKQRPVMNVGDLTAKRDFSDVRDIVRGYRLAITRGKAGEVYHFCSGRAVAVQTLLDTLLSFSDRTIKVTQDKKRLRKSDIPVLRGSNRKATQQLGFNLRYTLRDTLSDTLEYWRRELGATRYVDSPKREKVRDVQNDQA
ncbi:MAG: GDP-mannose 4,6-dehydratase, partial [candidate division Zixibacteria bacterium]|nr:GDP-mannose 4,6-dehydratase [candidate division Zixibacteria bacterium]